MHRPSYNTHQYTQNVQSNFLPANFTQSQQMQQIGQHGYSYPQNNQGSMIPTQPGFKQVLNPSVSGQQVVNPSEKNIGMNKYAGHQTLPQTSIGSQSGQSIAQQQKWQMQQQANLLSQQNRLTAIQQQQQTFRPVVSSHPASVSGSHSMINGISSGQHQNQRISPRPHQTYSLLSSKHQTAPLARSMSANQGISIMNVSNSGQIPSGIMPSRSNTNVSVQQRVSPHAQVSISNKNMSPHVFGSSRSNSTGDISTMQNMKSTNTLNGSNLAQQSSTVPQAPRLADHRKLSQSSSEVHQVTSFVLKYY